MSQISKREKIETATMEPHLSGDSLMYIEKSYEASAWRCDGCGLVWEKKHQAAHCEERKHVTSYDDKYYGRGAVVNGQFTGTVTVYTRRAIRRESLVESQ